MTGMMSGFCGLLQKEVLRFWRVFFQTVFAPVLASFLYLLIFSHILEGRVVVYDGIGYAAFLAPGLAMMAILQNSFANASSSLIQSKITGNLVFFVITAAFGAGVFSGIFVRFGGAGDCCRRRGFGYLLVFCAAAGADIRFADNHFCLARCGTCRSVGFYRRFVGGKV